MMAQPSASCRSGKKMPGDAGAPKPAFAMPVTGATTWSSAARGSVARGGDDGGGSGGGGEEG